MNPGIELAPVLAQLREDLGHRRIRSGIERLEQLRPVLEQLNASQHGAGVFLGLLAQWVDAGFDCPELLRRLLRRFPPGCRNSMPVIDYLHLRMAEGVVEMFQENLDEAIRHFRFVQALEDEIEDVELLAIANFWIGRSMRRSGRYDDARSFVIRGEELALSCGYLQMAAITQVTQSWLAFQKGDLDEAVAMLRRAEQALSNTDDFLNLGNIKSAHGRIARRQGRYESAVEYFQAALCYYRKGGGGQMQMGRTLQNLAFVQRLRALHLQKELDSISASRRSGGGPSGQTAILRSRIQEIRSEAAAEVEESLLIYTRANSHRGIAGGHIVRGFLRLDAGDLESASAEAAEAFRHGDEKRDYLVMARARTLQCIIENAVIEEQIGDPAARREAAAAFAREAVSCAGKTQNRRVLARAYVWQGLVFAGFSDQEGARRCCDHAIALLQPEAAQEEYVWEDLETLKATLVRSAPIEPRLKAWSAGIVADGSFQELTEEFARIVIPKVWEREDRKISRVAEKLSISPKKVRRILQAVRAIK